MKINTLFLNVFHILVADFKRLGLDTSIEKNDSRICIENKSFPQGKWTHCLITVSSDKKMIVIKYTGFGTFVESLEEEISQTKTYLGLSVFQYMTEDLFMARSILIALIIDQDLQKEVDLYRTIYG